MRPRALRVNPDVDAHTHRHTTTGTHETKFGVPFDEACASSSPAPAAVPSSRSPGCTCTSARPSTRRSPTSPPLSGPCR
ncbi:MAG: hypothetical protein U1A27_13955 [Phycisphaerae bacterium]